MVGRARLHLLFAGALTVELVVKGEGLLLGGQVDVACAATATAELGGGLGQAILEEGCRARGGSRVGGLGGLEGVASTTTARIDVVAGRGVGFGDGIGGGHCWNCVSLREGLEDEERWR